MITLIVWVRHCHQVLTKSFEFCASYQRGVSSPPRCSRSNPPKPTSRSRKTSLRSPGVYIEKLPLPARSILSVDSSAAAFVGPTLKLQRTRRRNRSPASRSSRQSTPASRICPSRAQQAPANQIIRGAVGSRTPAHERRFRSFESSRHQLPAILSRQSHPRPGSAHRLLRPGVEVRPSPQVRPLPGTLDRSRSAMERLRIE